MVTNWELDPPDLTDAVTVCCLLHSATKATSLKPKSSKDSSVQEV